MSDIKLTKAQREWLGYLAKQACWAEPRYRPVGTLAGHGFASRDINGIYTITPAGRAWLAANPRKKK